jgi:hypothetical protein
MSWLKVRAFFSPPSEDRIKEIKERQTVLEVKFSEIQTGDVLNGHKVHFTKLLVPLSGQFSNGTVFFAGIWDRLLGGKELKYSSLQDYGSTNFVRNTRGLDHLKGKLQKMSIMID